MNPAQFDQLREAVVFAFWIGGAFGFASVCALDAVRQVVTGVIDHQQWVRKHKECVSPAAAGVTSAPAATSAAVGSTGEQA